MAKPHIAHGTWTLNLQNAPPQLLGQFSGQDAYEHRGGSLTHLSFLHLIPADHGGSGNHGFISFTSSTDIGRFIEKKAKHLPITVNEAKTDDIKIAEGFTLLSKEAGNAVPLHTLEHKSTDGPSGQQLLFDEEKGNRLSFTSRLPNEAAGMLRELVARGMLEQKAAASLFLQASNAAQASGEFKITVEVPEGKVSEANRLIERKIPAVGNMVIPPRMAASDASFADTLRDNLLEEAGIAWRGKDGPLVPAGIEKVKLERGILNSLGPAAQKILDDPQERAYAADQKKTRIKG